MTQQPNTAQQLTSQIIGLCRDCMADMPHDVPQNPPHDVPQNILTRCPSCKSPRLIYHPELNQLGIAHIDCDAFYAAVEKRDNPALEDKPLIIGGGRRGVVATCCYIARIKGVRSAMPMFKALQLCPDAVIIKPNGAKYAQTGQEIRDLMTDVTPLVQPLSIDEAFLDLRGTTRLHGATPAASLMRLMKKIKKETGITVSAGLSHNKFLAKLASDMDKPNGFTVIGTHETKEYLARLPVSKLWGVGSQSQKKLARDGITKVSHLQNIDETDLMRRYGQFGLHLSRLARGQDSRPVTTEREAKSISAETTFETDIKNFDRLAKTLWQLCEKVSRNIKKKGKGGTTIVLKLKTSDFKSLTRNRKLTTASQMAEMLYQTSLSLLKTELEKYPKRYYRLIGVGFSGLVDADFSDQIDLGDPDKKRREAAEVAMDDLRDKFGYEAIKKGRSLS